MFSRRIIYSTYIDWLFLLTLLTFATLFSFQMLTLAELNQKGLSKRILLQKDNNVPLKPTRCSSPSTSPPAKFIEEIP